MPLVPAHRLAAGDLAAGREVHGTQWSELSTHDAQVARRALGGQGNLWFAGGWTRAFDAQETCLLSALAVADGLGADSAHARALAAVE